MERAQLQVGDATPTASCLRREALTDQSRLVGVKTHHSGSAVRLSDLHCDFVRVAALSQSKEHRAGNEVDQRGNRKLGVEISECR